MVFAHNTNRIETFSDAVFAFAATLMMVSINGGDSFSVLEINWVNFIGFFVSFFVLLFLWKAHYSFFRRTNYIDNWIIALNSIQLFAVLYFVLPLKTLISTMFRQRSITIDDLASLFELYSIGLIVIFLTLALMYLRVSKKDSTAKNKAELQFYFRHFSIYVIVALISIALSVLELGLRFGGPGFIYFLIGPACFLNSWRYQKLLNNSTPA